MAEFDRQKIAATAALMAEVAIKCNDGDPEKMVAFVMREFTEVLAWDIGNVDEVAALICASLEQLRLQSGKTDR